MLKERCIRIAVIGMGYVGVPLAVEFARGGLEVVGIDTNGERVDAINAGRSYVVDVPDAAVAEPVAGGRLRATGDCAALAEVEAACICVPTPLRKSQDPDISHIVEAVEQIRERLHSGMTIVLESTTYPGTTEELVLPKLEETGLRVGKDFFLAFSPERVDPGNRQYGVRNTPKVIGGVTRACTEKAVALYRHAVDTLVPVADARAAEMVKLLENTFRAINIGMVNELALICDRLGVDVWEVIEAAKTKPFGFMPFYPGPGLGGHCIPIDPLYLSWKMKTINYTARFIELASAINAGMPSYVVEKAARALNDRRKSVNGSRILVLGVAYKRDVSDTRESPAVDIIGMLQSRGAEVAYADPHVPTLDVTGATMTAHDLRRGAAGFDLLIIVTDHTAFDYPRLLSEASLVLDTRNATSGFKPPDGCTIIKL
ncbi:MAG TPA: nucleotide sugar dehydrogenase [Candidatus Hydrogenedentes bacterium]|nr:nucleotide sugar dehydrogenase [Candidatus Hydrogenedentota bacterium]HNT88672.1 nucleotide sugar dehydrogenase [Candidatus Hydrogenedentota bacterium]